MAKKLVCLKNFYDSNFKKDGIEEELGTHKQWMEGEEYTGSDDKKRLEEEGCIGEEEPEEAPSKGKKAPAKRGKKAPDLNDGEAVKTDGEPAGETIPAAGKEPDGEEEVEDEEPAKPAKKTAKAKGGKKKG